jgi:hypothetical protein
VAGSSEGPHSERRLRLVEDSGPKVDFDDDVETLLRPLLLEAERQMRKVRGSLGAEMWASELFGMVELAMPDADPTDREDACAQVAALLIGHAERTADSTGLAMVWVLSRMGPEPSRAAAVHVADRLAASGVKEPSWAAALGTPRLGRCWRYGDVDGRQEVVTASFRYGRQEHALSVLIDHDLGGGVKDCWLANDAAGVLEQTLATVVPDPLTEFTMVEWAQARLRIERALRRPECPVDPDQVEDVAMTRAVLLARLALPDVVGG